MKIWYKIHGSFKVVSLVWVISFIQSGKALQVNLIKLSYTNLWVLIPLLYALLSIIESTEPSAIIPDSIQKSVRPASWNLFPIKLSTKLHIVWKVPMIHKTIPWYTAFSKILLLLLDNYSAWSNTSTTFTKLSCFMILYCAVIFLRQVLFQ